MTHQTRRAEIATKKVVYQMPGMDAVRIRRDVPYAVVEGETLTIDVYYPGDLKSGARTGAVLFVIGYPDAGVQKVLGCKAKEMESYISWAKLVAASGLIAITYTPRKPAEDVRTALLIAEGADLACAALIYGYMFDLGGSTAVADAARTFGFVNPVSGRSPADLPSALPVFIVRAGLDEMPGLNESIDRFAIRALQANRPVTLVNHHTGPHAFDIQDDSEASREIVRQILAFLRLHLAMS